MKLIVFSITLFVPGFYFNQYFFVFVLILFYFSLGFFKPLSHQKGPIL